MGRVGECRSFVLLRSSHARLLNVFPLQELDAKKKKKKGTLGIGNSALFFASESDKAPVQKISVLSIVGHTVEGKGKQLNLELDEEGARKIGVDDVQATIRFVSSSKGEVEEIWSKVQESQKKAREANEEPLDAGAAPPPVHALPPAVQRASIPPPTAAVLPPPVRAASAKTSAVTSAAAPTPTPQTAPACIALYDFEAQGDDELSVAENEKLVLVEKENDDWWKVQNSAGQEGVVPASYVEVGEGTDTAATVDEQEDAEYAEAAAEQERLRIAEEEEEAAERARMQAERKAKADAQRRAREAEERRREAIKSQPAPARPKAPATTATTASSSTSRDIAIPSGRSAPARPKEASSKAKPSPARTRIWHDRTAQFRVEAEFLGFNQGKIRLHKLNGVVIEVAVEKMSNADIQYLEDVTGRKLAPPSSSRGAEDPRRSERERERRREQDKERKRRQESARGPKRNVDWFEFFLAAQVDVDDCTRYAAAFERDKIDENVLPDMEPGVLRSIGLREGDIIRVMKFITKKYKPAAANGTGNATDAGAQLKSDEALARKLQEQEQQARRNGVTPPPNLFSGPDGSLKNNTRRGRPAPNSSRSMSSGVDAASLAAASESLARTTSPVTRSNATSPEIVKANTRSAGANGFEDDAWTPRPSSTKPSTPAPAPAPTPASAPVAPTPPPAPVTPAAPPAPAAPTPPTIAPATPAAEPAKPPADPNSALFDKLAAMRPPSGGSMQRPGASPVGGANMFNGPRGPYAPVAQNQNLLQPLLPTQGTGQFVPTGLGHQQTGMQPQQTGYMGAQPTGMGGYATGNGFGSMSSPQPPFGMQAMVSQPTGYGGMQPQYTGFSQQQQQPLQPQMTNVSGFAQPQAPQFTQHQYQVQQQHQANVEANSESNPDRFSAANVFGQMKQGNLHQDPDKSAQSAQKYDALRAQPTGFQPGGYLNPQFTGYGYPQQHY